MICRFFEIKLHGEGLVLFSPDGSFRAGFFATRKVKARDENDAREKAIAIVNGELCQRIDEEYRVGARIEVRNIREINSLQFFLKRVGGFTFYEL